MTLTVAVATYTTVVHGVTLTVTANETTDVDYTTYTTVIVDITTTVTEECTTGITRATFENDVTVYNTIYNTVDGEETTTVTQLVTSTIEGVTTLRTATSSSNADVPPAVSSAGENMAGVAAPKSVIIGLAVLVAGLVV